MPRLLPFKLLKVRKFLSKVPFYQSSNSVETVFFINTIKDITNCYFLLNSGRSGVIKVSMDLSETFHSVDYVVIQ